MDRICVVQLGFVTVLCLGFFVGVLSQDDDSDTNVTAVYIVTLRQPPAVHHFDEELMKHASHHNSKHGATAKPSKPKQSRNVPRHSRRPRRPGKPRRPKRPSIAQSHESLLRRVFRGEAYLKLYSYSYLINGFAVLVTPQQADKLSQRKEVANVVLDFSVRTATTHTPQFLGLTQGAWVENGGYETAGEGIVIGFIDTGIDPTHPSFSDNMFEHPFPVPAHFSGACEVTPDFPAGSCNRKLVGARHFAASAITRGIFNLSQDYASPFDGDGHGTHTAAVAAGNHGIPVVVAGHNFGNASGMAPRAHVSVYKALFKSFGGFAADVVAAIDQAAQDGVNIMSLSITPNRRPPGVATFFNPIDMALLSAVKAGIFVVQAAGNTGPSPGSMSSFSPWIFTVGAAAHDRIYPNSITLGNNLTVPGVGLAPGTEEDKTYTLISALHAVDNNVSVTKDMYVGECQDRNSFNQDLVRGNLLICSYSIRFELGLSTIQQALDTARNLSAAGVVFYMDPQVVGFQLNPTPMNIPGIVIPSPQDSKVLLEYYNSLVEKDEITKEIVRFKAVGRISGGLEAKYGKAAPKIMFYSARGPDPEDSSLNEADIMKPNLVAPGNLIWAAWSSSPGSDSVEFQGENFAMMSGTSMSASHIAGIAALVKQKFPYFSPSAIASSLSTSATLYDNNGGPVMAQRGYANPDQNQSPATPFDMGSGFVNATAALDPGLIFDTSFEDYISFLCSINGSSPAVLDYTGQNCLVYNSSIKPNLNLPSITIAKLYTTRTIQRWARNVASNETYNVGWSSPYGVSMEVSPTRFSVSTGETQSLTVIFNATMNSSSASFGRIGLFGNMGHMINISVSVIVKSL